MLLLQALTALTLDGNNQVCAAAKEIAEALPLLTRLQHLSLGIAEADVDISEADRDSIGSEEEPSYKPWMNTDRSESDSIASLAGLSSHGHCTSSHHSAEQQPNTVSEPPQDSMSLICEVIQELKQLRSLSIFFNPMTAEAAQQLQELGTATQLTLLRLDAHQLTEDSIVSLLNSLPIRLKHLDLGGETTISAECLAVLGQGLPHLTQLEMGCLLPWCHLAPAILGYWQ